MQSTSCLCPACNGEGSFWSGRSYGSYASSPDADRGGAVSRACLTCEGTGEITVESAWCLLSADLAACPPAFVRAWEAKWGREDGPELASTLPAPASKRGAA
jgi:hypothetical protein